MSAAEITARRVYEDYHIGALTEDVQRQLIILMLSHKNDVRVMSDDIPPRYTDDEIHSRIATAERDILNGNTCVAEDMESRIENKYPWLCK